MTQNTVEVPLPALILLLSQKQEFQSLPPSKENLNLGRIFSLVLECRIWITEAMSYYTWRILNPSGKILSWTWIPSLDQEKYSYFTNSAWRLGDGKIIQKAQFVVRGGKPWELSSHTSSFRASERTSRVAQKSSFWKTDWKCYGICL